jgi:hypothetical protein
LHICFKVATKIFGNCLKCFSISLGPGFGWREKKRRRRGEEEKKRREEEKRKREEEKKK